MLSAPHPALAFGVFVLDPKRRLLLAGGQPVALQPRAFHILEILLRNAGRSVQRSEILAEVWPSVTVTEANVTVHLSNLRRALALHHGADMIVTDGRGYRFVADVTVIEPHAPPLSPRPPRARAGEPRGKHWRLWAALCLPVAAAAMLLLRSFLMHGNDAPLRLHAEVRVETRPDEVAIAAGGYHLVDYVFTLASPIDLQLESDDIQFLLASGQPVGTPNIGGRILHGTFALRGGATGVYHNNIYLPPDIAAAGLAAGGRVQLRHQFHLRTVNGDAVSIPAMLEIIIAGPMGRQVAGR